MTRAEIRTAIANLRFNSTSAKLAQIEDWIEAAELELWNAAEWVFKRVAAENLTVTASDATPSMPAGFAKATRLWDDDGCPLRYLDPNEFEELAVPDSLNAVTGTPAYYTVINREIHLAPTPQSSATFKLSYRRRYVHRADGSTVTAGTMNSDNDTPVWDSEHHYVLVPWAMRIGIGLEGDAVPRELDAECVRLFEAMRSDLVSGVEGEVRVWGAGVGY